MFNKRLKSIREKSGMTQKEVAKKVGISQRVYAYYETERFPRDEETIRKFARLFDCSADYLLGLSDFVNYEEIKKINEETELFKQTEDPAALEKLKNIFSTLNSINKNMADKSDPIMRCLKTMVDSVEKISSSYHPNMNFFEFKAISSDKVDTAHESIKKMANELANELKNHLNGFDKDD